MHRPDLRLIKDFKAGQFILFWADMDRRKRASPRLHSLKEAEEWWLKKHFSLYEGPERRKTIVDRRKLHEEREKRMISSHFISAVSDGRRFTDRPIQVELDRSHESMMKFMSRS